MFWPYRVTDLTGDLINNAAKTGSDLLVPLRAEFCPDMLYTAKWYRHETKKPKPKQNKNYTLLVNY